MSAPVASRRDVLLRRLLDGQQETAARIAPIPRRRGTGSAPLSFSQERFWFLDRLSPGNPFYVESVAVAVPHGTIGPSTLKIAIDAVVRRHEILRTGFEELGNGAVQTVLPHVDIPLAVKDLAQAAPERRDAEVARLLRDNATLPFDLSRPPLLRFLLIEGLGAENILAMAVHHIISDGWSMRILQREINAAMQAAATGHLPDLPPLPIQYADFAAWQRGSTDTGQDWDLAYWRGQLAGLPALELPLDHLRPQILGFRGAHLDVAVPANISSGAKILAAREGATLFMVTLAAFAAVLRRHSGQDDVVVGTPVAGRSRSELEPLIGLFLNTVVLRIDLSGNPPFRELISRVRKVAIAAFDSQHTPFERIVEELQPERDLGRNPLFQVLFQLYTPHDVKAGAATQTKAIEVEKGAAILDLSAHFWEDDKGIRGRLEYSTELFEKATIQRLFGHFVQFLGHALASPGRRISEIEMLSDVERAEALALARGPDMADDTAPTLPAAFAARVAAHPDRIALFEENGGGITFADLDHRMRRIAGALAMLGVARGDRVVICLDRSTDAVAAMLAVMWLGAAYVAVDPDYPQDRIRFVVEDSAPKAVVTIKKHRAKTDAVAPILALDAAPLPDGPLPPPVPSPDDLAYLIYTSGSTGRPKGVMAAHKATMNRFAWMWRRFPFADGEVTCLKTALAFVDSVWETFGPLLAGCPSAILTDAAARDPLALCAALGQRQVTRLLLVPSLLRAILDARIDLETAAPRLRLLFTSGEQLTADLLDRVSRLAPSIDVINLYGSSEVAGDVTCTGPLMPLAEGAVSIGSPLDNCQVYILDAQMRLVPRGALGQLHVGGRNLARGYFGQPALTAERFVPDPFAAHPGARLFQTGDLVRLDASGALIFEGRRDHQVKLRGHRIELGEIEAALQDHPDVGQAVVAMSQDETGGRLDASLTVTSPGAPDEGVLRRFLAQRLPAYMIPTGFTVIDAFPLLPNGKLDRAALRGSVPAAAVGAVSAQPPETDAEIALAALWSELLKRPAVGRDDNFFDIGGHSLLATRLITTIRDRFDLDLPLTTIFLHPTLRELASEIERVLLAEIEAETSERGLP